MDTVYMYKYRGKECDNTFLYFVGGGVVNRTVEYF